MKSLISVIIKSNNWYDNLSPIRHLMAFLSLILTPMCISSGIATYTENYLYMTIPVFVFLTWRLIGSLKSK